MAEENHSERGRATPPATHRPHGSNVDPKTALAFVIGILVIVGLLTLGVVLLFGRAP